MQSKDCVRSVNCVPICSCVDVGGTWMLRLNWPPATPDLFLSEFSGVVAVRGIRSDSPTASSKEAQLPTDGVCLAIIVPNVSV